VELRQLRFFVAVAEELHFGRAAARLGVVQPAVSQQLSRLERELGLRLLERGPHRVALTDSGARLLAEARTTLAAADKVRDTAAGLARGRADIVRLGTAPGLGPRVLRGLTTVLGRSPQVELVLVPGDATTHVAALARGQLDLALVRGAVESPPGLAVRVGEDPVSVVLPASHPAARQAAVRVEDLADLPLRLPSRAADPELCDAVLARCAAAGRTVRRGRDVTALEDAAIEIAAGAAAWTVVHGQPPSTGTCGVTVRPLDPPLHLSIFLLLPAAADPCHERLAAAFS
jgi:DNA-binding transcriptional LysR family regulator